MEALGGNKQIYNENIYVLVSEPPKKCRHF